MRPRFYLSCLAKRIESASTRPWAGPPIRRFPLSNYVEAGIRADQDRMPGRGAFLDEVVQRFDVKLAFVTPEQAKIAREAYRQYGKGNHAARLSLGDCFAYALAKARNQPLLFKGDDFTKTDIEAAG